MAEQPASLARPKLPARPAAPSTGAVRLPLPANDNRSPYVGRLGALAGWAVAAAVMVALLWSLAD